MNKRDIRLLEKVFANEINPDREWLPFQSKSKQYERLEKEGYVVRVTETLPGRFPVEVTGWALTLLGNMTYCRYCGYTVSEEELV